MAISFNGYDLSNYMDIGRIRRDILPPRSIRTLEVPDKAGAYFMGLKKDVRVFEVPVRIKASSYEELQNRLNELVEILDTEEPRELVFHREPDKSFFAIVADETQVDPVVSMARGTIRFLCVDPYKYGIGVNQDLGTASGIKELYNNGNASVAPIWTVDFQAPATYFSVISADGFVMVGRPEALDQATVPPEQLILWDEMDDLAKWTTSGVTPVHGNVAGSFMIEGGHQTKVSSFGDDAAYPSAWHGPAARQALSTPLQDFRLEAEVQLYSGKMESGRIEIVLFDESNRELGRMVLWDKYTGELSTAYIYAGTVSDQREIIASAGVPKEGDWNDFLGKLIIRREGTTWKAVVVKTDAKGNYNYKHYLYHRMVVPEGSYSGRFATIQIHMTKYGSRPAPNMAIRDIKVHRLNQVQATENPELFQAGDRLVIDHEKAAVFLNGRYFQQHLDIGSKFFKLWPGINDIDFDTNNPANTLLSVAYRERWK